MVRHPQRSLNPPLDVLRAHLHRVVSAGIVAASAHDLLVRTLGAAARGRDLRTTRLHVIAAGKAASSMARALMEEPGLTLGPVLAVGTHRELDLPAEVEWHAASHPFPDERSVAAGERALAVARGVPPGEQLLLLLSGGASSLLVAPIEGISLDDKRRVVRALINGGTDIHALNAVRKHLSRIKGGRLAAACAGRTTTLAVSDVVGDDLSMIGSGPGVPDPSTWQDALGVYRQWTPSSERLPHVEALLERGADRGLAETPKPGDATLQRSAARIIGGRADAMRGAREEAERLGYHVVVVTEPVVGEARVEALHWIDRVRSLVADTRRPMCVISSGETTVRVTGTGKGGRNQEFTLALVEPLTAWTTGEVAAASSGTDGIDGPTDAAGAIADATTMARAQALGLPRVSDYLSANDSYAFFHALGDLVQTGRTDTNVGDLQILLFAPSVEHVFGTP